jgi:hypothetical protein
MQEEKRSRPHPNPQEREPPSPRWDESLPDHNSARSWRRCDMTGAAETADRAMEPQSRDGRREPGGVRVPSAK